MVESEQILRQPTMALLAPAICLWVDDRVFHQSTFSLSSKRSATSITPMPTATSTANAASHSFNHRSPPPALNVALAFCNLSHNVPLSRRLEEPVQKTSIHIIAGGIDEYDMMVRESMIHELIELQPQSLSQRPKTGSAAHPNHGLSTHIILY